MLSFVEEGHGQKVKKQKWKHWEFLNFLHNIRRREFVTFHTLEAKEQPEIQQ